MKHFYHFLMILFIFGFTNQLYSQSVPSYVPTNGLVGWWGFNGNAQDGSGNGNHGTVNGATLTSDRLGNTGMAFSFNGISDFISLAQPFFQGSTNVSAFTYHVIIKINQLPNGNSAYAISTKEGYWRTLAMFVQNNGGISFGGSQPSSYIVVGTNPNAILLNQWTHITLTYENSTLKLYLNGLLSATSSIPYSTLDFSWPALGNSTSTNLIGASYPVSPGLCNFFSGVIDDFGTWNRALTQQEITNLYNSQLPTQTSLCLPSITTNTPTSIGIDSVIVGGNITNDGGSSIVLRGVCYSTTPNPDMGTMRTEDGSGVGSFSTILRNLNPSTTYYVRSYAKNSNGVVVYGDEVSFSTGTLIPSFSCGTSTVSDVDGNNYNTVQIGTQCWTQSNLKVSKYRNGDSIPTGLSDTAWQNTTAGAYAIYENNPVHDGWYGKLYNHYAVMDTRGLCPTGWHVPTDSEWNVMVKYLDPNADTVCSCEQSGIAGGALKSTVTQPTPGGWAQPNTGATNSSGFSAGPGGFRDGSGGFFIVGTLGYWWSSSLSGTNAWTRNLHFDFGNIYRYTFFARTSGLSVRCLRD